MTDELGGVYVEVDRRYYLTTAGSTRRSTWQPGYRLLDGADASRFRALSARRQLNFGRMERRSAF